MIGGQKLSSRLALFATAAFFAGGVSIAPAQAGGDLGGDCCADLEERVAELEATTVRKGNRKVSLKLSGHVNKAIIWDDRNSRDYDIWDAKTSQSRIRLTGKATITSDLYAGYAIVLGLGDGSASDISADGIFSELRQNQIYFGSKTLGKISIGKGNTASNGTAEVDLSGTAYLGGGSLAVVALAPSDSPAYTGFSNLDGFSRKERIRYDSPTLAGFKVSASWQDNDDTDVGVRFANTFGDFKVAAAVGIAMANDTDTDNVSGSVSVLHIPTGLNFTYAGGDNDAGFDYDFFQGGIKKKIFPAGVTAFSVGHYDSTTAERTTGTIVQNIDAAATQLYISFTSADDVNGDDSVTLAGARIKF